MRSLLLTGILVLAFLLRAMSLAAYPVGFTPDEASFGYDAYSMLITGKDQWGEAWPLTFRSFGDFKLPLYTYLSIPSVAVFGLNEFATRFPNAILGTLAVLVTYLMVVELLAKHGKTQNRTRINTEPVALLAATLLAFSPWHIALSRGAFEATLTTFFIPLGLWAFFQGFKVPRWMLVAALAFGLNLFTYHSARFFTPLLVCALVWWHRRDLAVSKFKWALLTFVVFFGITLYLMFSGAGARGTDIAIFNPTDRWQAVAQRRYQGVLQGVPDEVARAFSNKLTYVWDQFISNYLSYLSPQFLFTQGAGEWTYGMIAGRGVLYLIELPFLLFALFSLIKNWKGNPLQLFIFWILLSPIPAALTKGPGLAANRVAVMMPAIQILSAYGGVLLFNTLTKWINQRKLTLFYSLALLLSLGFFLEDYRYHTPIDGAKDMLYGRGEAVEFVKSIENNYSEIVFSRSLSEPHIFVAFYNQWNPTDYQKQAQDWLRYQKEGRLFVDQLGEYRLGKYVFSDVDFEKYRTKSDTLLVGKPNEFPQNIAAIKTINYPSGEPAILIVDSGKQIYAKNN